VRLSEATSLNRTQAQEKFSQADPGTLLAILKVVILVIEFAKTYREEIGMVGRLVLKATGWDKRLEQLESEAKEAIGRL
jgi:hypothetical protein